MKSLVWIALVVNLIATIPQLAQIVKTGEARDFNTTSITLSLIANLLIGMEAVRRRQPATMVLSVWLIIYWLVILSYKLETF